MSEGCDPGAAPAVSYSSLGDMGDEHRLLATDTRLLDPAWEYYERTGDTLSIISNQPQYRPWESMPITVNSKDAILRAGFSTPLETYQSVTLQPIANKLPSFQSQFQTFPESTVIPETGLPSVTPVPVSASSTPSASPSHLTQLTQLTTASSPAHLTSLAQVTPLSTTLTTLSPVNATTFHTLTAVNARSYPIVPAPIQARELTTGQTYIDDRHIQLYQPNIATINAFPAQNGILHQNGTLIHQNGSLIQNIQSPTVVHVLKNEPFDMKSLHDKYTPNGLHHANFQSPMLIDNSYDKKANGYVSGSSPTRSDYRKKERRKIRANSSESDGSSMEVGSESSGQVAAVSSTAGFKSPMHGAPPGITGPMELDDMSNEKQTKKKRKRCGECIGCQRKDNCGDCAPCRNDKSHQICKQRRCEKLTEKKLILAPDGTLQTVKSESRRGRGRGRSSSTPSFRGRKPLGGSAGGAQVLGGVPGLSPGVPAAASPSPAPQAPAAPSPSPATAATMKQEHPSAQPMAPMPFYAGDPNRFQTWQTDPTQGWQNQFIQQLPTQTGQTTLDYQGNHTAAYAATPYQTANTTYTVQNVATTFDVTNNTYYQTGIQTVPSQRPPSNRGAYTPVPSPRAPQQHYTNEYQQQYAQAATPVASVGNESRPASAASYQSAVPTSAAPVYTNNQNSYDTNNYTSEHTDDSFNNTENRTGESHNSEGDRQQGDNANNSQHSGNAEPGYLQGSNGPRASLDCNGYSGNYNSGHELQQQYANDGTHEQQTDWSQQQWQHNQMQNQQQMQQQNMQNQQMQQQQLQNHMQQRQEETDGQQMFSQSDRVNLNSRLKTMILNKQNHTKDSNNTPPDKGDPGEGPPRDERDKTAAGQQDSTGHFLSYSHHLRDNYPGSDTYLPSGSYHSLGGGGHNVWEGGTHPPPYHISRHDAHYHDQPHYQQHDNKDFHSKMLIGPVSQANQHNYTQGRDTNAQTIGYVRDTYDNKYKNPGVLLVPKLEAPDTYQYQKEDKAPKTEPPMSANQHSFKQVNERPPSNNYKDFQNGILSRQNTVLPPISTIKQENFNQKPQPPQYQQFPGGFYPYDRRTDQPQPNYPQPNKFQETVNSNTGFQRYNRSLSNEHRREEPLRSRSERSSPVERKPFYVEQIKSEHSPPGHKIYKNNFSQLSRSEPYLYPGDGGPVYFGNEIGYSCCRQGSTKKPPAEHLRDGACPGLQTKDEIIEGDPDSTDDKSDIKKEPITINKSQKDAGSKAFLDNLEKMKNNAKTEVPECNCFPADKNPPEPGSYYTHLGAASSLLELRKDLEARTGLSGKELRIEKICYTGKEGKSAQGCPIAKWIIRRTNYTEKVLVVVKYRNGHKCPSSWIVVCLVAWEGIPQSEADLDYTLLSHKLNRYGLPTTRRCATNENRTCACQGLDPETCGASYSFGCSWSMYYNGCKYARSKTVRKFRLSVKTEESEIEERMHVLATLLSPLYMNLAPKSFENQCLFEKEASDCRLGFKAGRPFSGVTACIDFCAHSHRDLHNMNNGCTAVVTLARHRALNKPNDEQLHVLPLYVLDTTDEFGSKEGQEEKVKNGALEVLDKYPMEVRVRSVPLQPCRRHGKKRKDEDTTDSANTSTGSNNSQSPAGNNQKKQTNVPMSRTPQPQDHRNNASPRSQHSASPRSLTPALGQTNPGSYGNNTHYNSAFMNPNMHNTSPGNLMNANLGNPSLLDMASMIDNFTDAQLQSNQISSTVLDSPYNAYEQSYNLHHQNTLYNPNHMSPLVDGNSCQNSTQLPSFNSGLQKREQLFVGTPTTPNANPDTQNQWAGYNPEMFNNVVKEDPDSTTAHLNLPPNNYSPDSNRSETSTELIPQKTNIEVDKQNTIGPDLNLKSLPDFDMPSSPRLKEISQKSQSTPQSPASTQATDIKSPSHNTELERQSIWKSPDSKNWDPNKTKDMIDNENILFRVPKARPPSRPSHQNTAENLGNPTFLKPYPPSEKPYLSQGYDNRNPYDNRNQINLQTSIGQTNFTISHDEFNQNQTANKPNVPQFNGNNFQAVNQNNYGNQSAEIQGYGNYPQMSNAYPFSSNPYGHFNPYENSYNNYNSLAYYNAEKLKREELLRNPHCYNSYGYQYNPNFAPNFYQNPAPNWCQSSPNWCLYPPPFSIPYPPEPPKAEPIGEVTEFSDNFDCFKDSQMGGVAIALGHGSVLFECAKHEMHSTTAVRAPNRTNPTRISLVFYQHRNLNRPKHGLEEWEEKMRLKKLGLQPPATPATPAPSSNSVSPASTPGVDKRNVQKDENAIPGGYSSLSELVEATNAAKKSGQIMMRTETQTTMSWTTLFPMHPCTVTGPYQESAT